MMPFPPTIEHLVDALYPPARQALALEVATTERRLFWIGSALQLAIVAGIYYSGASAALRNALERWIKKPFRVAAVLVAGLVIASAIIMLPYTWYAGFTFPHHYGLSRESPADWFHDWAIALGLSTLITAGGAALFFACVQRFPMRWPLIVSAAAGPIVLVAVVILPVVIEPLFNTYTPLPASPLTRQILDIAARNGVKASSVYVFNLSKQSTAANAFVSGIGGTERIALADNLLATFQPDEAVYVTAHELGHYVHKDLWRGAAYGWLGVLVAIAFIWAAGPAFIRGRARGLGDPAVAPLLMALLLGFDLITQPIGNAISRGIEHNADVFAAENTHLGTAGVRAFARLGSQALSPLHPPPLIVWYFYDHPPLDERIMYAAHGAGLDDNPAIAPSLSPQR